MEMATSSKRLGFCFLKQEWIEFVNFILTEDGCYFIEAIMLIGLSTWRADNDDSGR